MANAELTFGDEKLDGSPAQIKEFVSTYFSKKPQTTRFLSLTLKSDYAKKVETMFCAVFHDMVISHLNSFPTIALPNLRQLVLTNIPVGLDSSVWELLPSLESLLISSEQNRPDGSDLSFLDSPKCKLTELALRKCKLKESDLKNLPSVKSIDLRDNCSLTDDQLKTFLNGKLNIERLGLQGLCEITGELLRFIAVFCPRMKLLHIADCPKINNEAIQGIVSARKSSTKGSPNPYSVLTIVAPGCEIDADASFLNMLKSGGVILLTNWADITRVPVVSHMDPSAIQDKAEEDWPFSARLCAEHRMNPIQNFMDVLHMLADDLALNDIDDDDDDDDDDNYYDDDFDDPDEYDEMEGY